MATIKISELPTIIGADTSDTDVLPIVDTSLSTTNKITRAEFFKNLPDVDINGGTIDGAVIGGSSAAAGTFTTVTGTSATINGNITVTGTVDGRDIFSDGSKLDGIEVGADVTDTTNVTAAGALMDSELTNIAAVKALDQGVATTDSPSFSGISLGGTAVTATAAELNILDGVTANTSEFNVLDGITVTTSELNYASGLTSNVQDQINAKVPINSPVLTGTPEAPTAAVGTNTVQIATTAFVNSEIASDAVPKTAATGSAAIPSGTQAQRDGSPSAGYFRFNSDVAKFEGYNGAAWGSVGGGATGGGSDEVFVENGQTVTSNYTLTTNKNALSVGPISINSGVTVTVPTGSNWVVL